MQLILNTETQTPSVKINEKMSTCDQEIVKPLPNGDIKEVVDEVNREPDINGASDKENAQNKENILDNCVEVGSHLDEVGSLCEPENIAKAKPVKKCTELQEIPTVENNASLEEKQTDKCKTDQPEMGAETKTIIDENLENAVQTRDDKETLVLSSKKETEQDKLDNSEVVEKELLASDENFENKTDEKNDENFVSKKCATDQDQLKHIEKGVTCSETVENILLKEKGKLEIGEEVQVSETDLEDTETRKKKEYQISQTEKKEELSCKKKLPLDVIVNPGLDVEKLDPEQTENLNEMKNTKQNSADLELDAEKVEPAETENHYLNEMDNTKQDCADPDLHVEILEPAETENDYSNKMENTKQDSADPELDFEKLELAETVNRDLNELDNTKQDSTDKLDTIEVDDTTKLDTRKTDSVITQKNEYQDLPESSGKVVADEVEKIYIHAVPISTSFSENLQADNLNLKNSESLNVQEKDTLKEGLVVSGIEKPEIMDIDENDSPIELNPEDMTEIDVTQSISVMVENIVQNINEDTADDLMEGIETSDENDPQKIEVEKDVIHKNIEKTTTVKEKFEKSNTENNKVIEDSVTLVTPDNNKVNQDDHVMEIVEKPNLILEVSEKVMDVSTDITSGSDEQLECSLPGKVVSEASTVSHDEHKITNINETSCSEESIKPVKSADKAGSDLNKISACENSEVAQVSLNAKICKPIKENNHIEPSCETTAKEDAVSLINIDNAKKVARFNPNTDCLEIIELTSANSSRDNVEDCNSSVSKIVDDIVLKPSNIDKVTNNDIQETVVENDTPEISEVKEAATDLEEIKLIEDTKQISKQKAQNEKTPEKLEAKKNITPLIKLSNTMDILSDEEEEPPTVKNDEQHKVIEPCDKQYINLDDDDDIMLIDEDTHKEDKKEAQQPKVEADKVDEERVKNYNIADTADSTDADNKANETLCDTEKDSIKPATEDKKEKSPITEIENTLEVIPEKPEKSRSLIPGDLFKSYRKNLADMTRDDLEEFCILKIVESIIDRSNLNEIRSKLKTMGQTIEDYKKKATLLTKQNRDLQVVLKSVQEEQKKATSLQPITPLKITRSVGMQVLMTDKNRRRVMPGPANTNNAATNVVQGNNRNTRNTPTTTQSPRNAAQKPANNQTIPVPRLVPAGSGNAANKVMPGTSPSNITNSKAAVQNGVKNVSPGQKPEKRTHTRMQSQSSSVTVDLTDDEPPSKVAAKVSPAPPVRLVNPQTLLAPRQQFTPQVNSPRKVYIPISLNGPQPPRPGQAFMVKTVSTQGPRARGPAPPIVRAPQNVQVRRLGGGARHPAPLPDAMKQYQPPNWKALPPAPDLKLSKVENGIVISWKIEGYQEDSYEEIASYQLYAYQETSAPPNTNLWKKIGDVKALPLPMACTLTQFMAGYKYYFAVRAVDIRSRLGPFSLPGSILLLNKM